MSRRPNNEEVSCDDDNLALDQRRLLTFFRGMERSAQLVLIDVAEEWAEAFACTNSQIQVCGGAA